MFLPRGSRLVQAGMLTLVCFSTLLRMSGLRTVGGLCRRFRGVPHGAVASDVNRVARLLVYLLMCIWSTAPDLKCAGYLYGDSYWVRDLQQLFGYFNARARFDARIEESVVFALHGVCTPHVSLMQVFCRRALTLPYNLPTQTSLKLTLSVR